jgi:hypothetical protein
MKQNEFVQVPVVFLEFGFPVRVNLYFYIPDGKKLTLFKKKGQVLEMDNLAEVTRARAFRLFALKSELEKAILEKEAEQHKQVLQDQEKEEEDEPTQKIELTGSVIRWVG